MTVARTQILDHEAIMARIRRMAYEIYEHNYQQTGIVVIGIDERGGHLAGLLVEELQKISDLQVDLVSADLDRSKPDDGLGIRLSADMEVLDGRHLVVVDDVLYTGRTLTNVVAILLQGHPAAIQCAVLIDRGHRSMPVSPDFVGFELATTIQQHVSMEMVGPEKTVTAFLE